MKTMKELISKLREADHAYYDPNEAIMLELTHLYLLLIIQGYCNKLHQFPSFREIKKRITRPKV